jgi:hypothetical protein
MKSFIAVLAALIVLSFSTMSQEIKSHKHHIDSTKVEKTTLHKQHKKAATVDKYTCVMHPEVISDKPGKCPKCKMGLVKGEAKKTMGIKSDVYTCPMHSDVKSDKPGKCPTCKMNLVKEKDNK